MQGNISHFYYVGKPVAKRVTAQPKAFYVVDLLVLPSFVINFFLNNLCISSDSRNFYQSIGRLYVVSMNGVKFVSFVIFTLFIFIIRIMFTSTAYTYGTIMCH